MNGITTFIGHMIKWQQVAATSYQVQGTKCDSLEHSLLAAFVALIDLINLKKSVAVATPLHAIICSAVALLRCI